jgi:hypothetical protein
MEKGTVDATRTMQLADLKELAFVEGPCLTITVPVRPAENTSRQDYMRLKSGAQAAETTLAERGLNPKQIREFLDPVSHIEGDSWGVDFGSLIVFRSPKAFRCFRVREQLKDSSVVSDRFQVLPLLRALQDEAKRFYVLALSQKHVRLLRCTNHSSDEVPLGTNVPTGLEQWLNTRTPTTSPDRSPSRASETGSTAGTFNSVHDRDNLDPHIGNFFHRINEAVSEVLRGETAPLVLAGVDYETSMYREINSYGHLAEGHVHGSPESLKGGELHKRAMEVAHRAFEEPMNKALQLYEKLGGSERVASKPDAVSKLAQEGRIAYLFVADGARDASTDDDLLNTAALQTVAHGGEVWVTSPEKVPGHGPVAALLRF